MHGTAQPWTWVLIPAYCFIALQHRKIINSAANLCEVPDLINYILIEFIRAWVDGRCPEMRSRSWPVGSAGARIWAPGHLVRSLAPVLQRYVFLGCGKMVKLFNTEAATAVGTVRVALLRMATVIATHAKYLMCPQ